MCLCTAFDIPVQLLRTQLCFYVLFLRCLTADMYLLALSLLFLISPFTCGVHSVLVLRHAFLQPPHYAGRTMLLN